MRSNSSSDQPGLASAAPPTPGPSGRWIAPLVILGALGVGSLAVGALFAPKTLLATGEHMNSAARVWARYAAAYSVALAIMLLGLLAVRARRILAGTLVQAAMSEVFLAVVAIVGKRWEQLPANAVLIAIFLMCATRLFGEKPWRAAVWRDVAL